MMEEKHDGKVDGDSRRRLDRFKEMRNDYDNECWLFLGKDGDEVTTAMEIADIGCIVKVSAPNGMAAVFVPDIMIAEGRDFRELVAMPFDEDIATTPDAALQAQGEEPDTADGADDATDGQ